VSPRTNRLLGQKAALSYRHQTIQTFPGGLHDAFAAFHLVSFLSARQSEQGECTTRDDDRGKGTPAKTC
jgi:hypothetical protein